VKYGKDDTPWVGCRFKVDAKSESDEVAIDRINSSMASNCVTQVLNMACRCMMTYYRAYRGRNATSDCYFTGCREPLSRMQPRYLSKSAHRISKEDMNDAGVVTYKDTQI
jgi:hypothetical protein